MTNRAVHIEMLTQVAVALGPLLDRMVFVGGCTTAIFIDDPVTLDQVRYTEDVDLIVNVSSYIAFHKLSEQLMERGFTPNTEDGVICRMNLGLLKVDFMPVDENVLGFSNRWYKLAVQTAVPYRLTEQLTIRVLLPVLFLATKLEAFKNRGNNDVLASHDIEDLLNVFDGRAKIVDEILQFQQPELTNYLRTEISALMKDRNFEYAVQATAGNNRQREKMIFSRLDSILRLF